MGSDTPKSYTSVHEPPLEVPNPHTITGASDVNRHAYADQAHGFDQRKICFNLRRESDGLPSFSDELFSGMDGWRFAKSITQVELRAAFVPT